MDINDGNWAGMAQANSWSHIYCLENCMFLDAQLNAYSTGVMFKANMDIAPDRVFNENGDVVSNQSNCTRACAKKPSAFVKSPAFSTVFLKK